MERKYYSLFHFIEEKEVENFSIPDIEKYRDNWLQALSMKQTKFAEKYQTSEILEKEIESLKNNLRIHKKIFEDQSLLLFLESHEINSTLPESISRFKDDFMHNHWIQKLFTNTIIVTINNRFREGGITNVEEIETLLSGIKKLQRNEIPSALLTAIKQGLTQEIDFLFRTNSEPKAAGHIKKILDAIPEGDELKRYYGNKLKSYVNDCLPRIKNGEIKGRKIIADVLKSATVASNILEENELGRTGEEIQRYINPDHRIETIGKKTLRITGIILFLLFLAATGYYLYNFFRTEGNNWEDRYAAYQKERNEYLMNRKLSKESIEMRKTVQLVENYHHADRNGLPVFHTYFQTNKYLDINEVDKELYDLGKKINADSLDVTSLFVKAFFFTTDKEKPYRTVITRYDQLKSNSPTYKQITIPRSNKSFVLQSFPDSPFKLNLQITDQYPSGVIDAFVFEMHIDPIKDSIEIYSINPTPELLAKNKLSTFQEIKMAKDTEAGDKLIRQALTFYQYLDKQKMVYRSQILDESVQFSPEMKSVSAVFNWELTLDDETAFIRIRSEDIKGYFLANKGSGELYQAKVSLTNNQKIRTDYIIQRTP